MCDEDSEVGKAVWKTSRPSKDTGAFSLGVKLCELALHTNTLTVRRLV